ncbi:hypothetical protein GPB2148_915 [marine gamma proteobacterium HTCC2148]|nr:hypothetical protein GPB2148_915 [marine gamma proteobacterium HTCC2148]
MMEFEEKLNGFAQIPAGHEGLPKHRVCPQVETQTQVQAQ